MRDSMSRVFCFSDSWGAGEELDLAREKPFAEHVAQRLGRPCVNYSQRQFSTGLILHRLMEHVHEITDQDLVLITCAPDVRWYDQDRHGHWIPVTLGSADSRNFFATKTLEWFEYHQALFVYTMQAVLTQLDCDYIMALAYGDINHLRQQPFAIDFDRFVSEQDFTSLLLGKPAGQGVAWRMQLGEDGPSEQVFQGPYFQGCRWHPNESGHRKIADWFIDHYHACKSR